MPPPARVHPGAPLRLVLSLIALLGLCPLLHDAPAAAAAPSSARAATARARDEALIRAALERHVARYNAREWQAMSAEYAEDALVMPSYVATVQGRERVNDLYRGEFHSAETTETSSVMEAHLDEIQVTGDWAYERGTIDIISSQGGFERRTAVRFMNILRRQPDGGWKITRSMDNPITPPFGSTRAR